VAIRPRRISDIKPLLVNIAQTSHYQVRFLGLPPQLTRYLTSKGLSSRFIVDDVGLLCVSASLPTSNLASANITGSYTGITENFAHTRQYNQLSLEFYVDNNYKTMIFLESWMEFIASGSYNKQNLSNENSSIDPNQLNYFSRMQYPDFYKANGVKIVKFERDYNRFIEYNFLGLYPQAISSPSISYTQSDTLKVSASFNYDRYVAGKWASLSSQVGDNNNQKLQSPSPTNSKPNTPAASRRPPTIYQTAQAGQTEGVSPRITRI
jgi:hypothetical protein